MNKRDFLVQELESELESICSQLDDLCFELEEIQKDIDLLESKQHEIVRELEELMVEEVTE